MTKAIKASKSKGPKSEKQGVLPVGGPAEQQLQKIQDAHDKATSLKQLWENAKTAARNAKANYDAAQEALDKAIEGDDQADLPFGAQTPTDDLGRPLHKTDGYVDPADADDE